MALQGLLLVVDEDTSSSSVGSRSRCCSSDVHGSIRQSSGLYNSIFFFSQLPDIALNFLLLLEILPSFEFQS